jgi:hypothetical protein
VCAELSCNRLTRPASLDATQLPGLLVGVSGALIHAAVCAQQCCCRFPLMAQNLLLTLPLLLLLLLLPLLLLLLLAPQGLKHPPPRTTTCRASSGPAQHASWSAMLSHTPTGSHTHPTPSTTSTGEDLPHSASAPK